MAEASALPPQNEMDTKIEQLATALEACIEEHNEHHIKCAPAYMEYAKALLHKAQLESDPFGGAIKKEEASSAPAQESSTGCAATSSGDAAAEEAEPERGEGEEGEEGEDANAEDEEEAADDLELAFQCFEVVRLIYEKEGGHEAELSEVLECLGEVAMENEMWGEAIEDLKRSLATKTKLLGSAHRHVAHLHVQIAMSAVAMMEKARLPPSETADPAEVVPPEEEPKYRAMAAENYGAAAAVLSRCLATAKAAPAVGSSESENIGTTNSPPQQASAMTAAEESDLSELLAEVRAKVEEISADPLPTTPAAKVDKGVTTIGFGAPVTTIGFGAPSASAASALPVKNLGVVQGRKKAGLEAGGSASAECQTQKTVKRVRLE